jgi:hypothetical protein
MDVELEAAVWPRLLLNVAGRAPDPQSVVPLAQVCGGAADLRIKSTM